MPMQQKTVISVFAHPDDEAFGPGGTIAKLAKHHRVYILCATKGQAGKDHGAKARRDLGERRARELRRSANILGVKKVFFLGFQDGTLSNNLYHQLADKILNIAKKLKPELLLTFEPGGGSGHIDHIMVSLVTSYVFARLPSARFMLQTAMPARRAKMMRGYFIYVPPGYQPSEIDLVVDVRDVWGQKLAAMMEHKSQIHDIERIRKFAQHFPKEENFLIKTKTRTAHPARALHKVFKL